LDFGTTATAAAVGGDGGPVSPLMLSDGHSTVSSSVFVDGEQVLVGAEADNAAEMCLDAYAPTPKRQVAQASVMLGGRELRPAQLIGAVLAPVLGEALRQHNQTPPTAVVLTHPVRWRKTRKDVLKEALTHAAVGLGVQLPDPVFLAEPIAAAQWHAQQNPPAEGQCLAVYDLGGGTFDATVLRRTATGFEPIGEGGIDPLGGFDFDQLLLNFLGERYIAAVDAGLWRELSDPQQPDPALARRRRQLQQQVGMLKVALTTEKTKSVRLTGVPDPKIVTRPEYEGLIREKVDATLAELQDTIADAGLDPDELAAVYRIGGAARTPLVGEALKHLHPNIKTEDHPKLVVAQGAALITGITPQPVQDTQPGLDHAQAAHQRADDAAAITRDQVVAASAHPDLTPQAHYELGELHRARNELPQADTEYGAAGSTHPHWSPPAHTGTEQTKPQPGPDVIGTESQRLHDAAAQKQVLGDIAGAIADYRRVIALGDATWVPRAATALQQLRSDKYRTPSPDGRRRPQRRIALWVQIVLWLIGGYVGAGVVYSVGLGAAAGLGVSLSCWGVAVILITKAIREKNRRRRGQAPIPKL